MVKKITQMYSMISRKSMGLVKTSLSRTVILEMIVFGIIVSRNMICDSRQKDIMDISKNAKDTNANT